VRRTDWLAIACVAAGLLAGCAAPPAVPPAEPPQDVPAAGEAPPSTPAPSPPTGPDPATLRITIAAVGDIMLGTDYPENRLPDDDAVGFLAAVAPILSAADIAFGNLEGVLLDGGEPAKRCGNPSACYLFRSPVRYAGRLHDAGFDALSLANNHARDFGEEGRTSSMDAIAALGMVHSGREGDFAEWEVNGLRIALAAFAVTRNSNMMLDVVPSAIAVGRLAAHNDIVIVSFHGGAEGLDALNVPFAEEEYYGEPRGDVVVFARSMVDAGADLVLGHGPHVVRAMERYRDRLIAYSLGNFATYYGISVGGLKGVAPIVEATLDGRGEFLRGRIHSTVQIRPDGPSIDDTGRALRKIRELSREDFGDPGLTFGADGALLPAPRGFVRQHEDGDAAPGAAAPGAGALP
jgi:hypothetical protein